MSNIITDLSNVGITFVVPAPPPPPPVTETWGENTGDDYNSRTEDSLVRINLVNRGTIKNTQIGDEDDYDFATFIRFMPEQDIAGKTIVSATLYLYNYVAVGEHNATVYRVLQNWVETEIKWDIFSTGNNWNTNLPFAANDGGVDDGIYDRHSTPLDTEAVSGAPESPWTKNVWHSWDITSLVQEWVNGTANEYGVMLFSDNSVSENRVKFRSREADEDGYRPYLEITYIP